MKVIVILTTLLLMLQPSQDESKILGTWRLAENNTEIEIVKDSNIYSGTVVKSDAQKAIGKVLLQDFEKDGDVWKGKFYAVKRDRLVDAIVTKLDENTLEMEVKAGRRSRTLQMVRVE